MRLLFFLLPLSAALYSCHGDISGNREEGDRVMFTISPDTRATDTAFEVGDGIGIYAVRQGEVLEAVGNFANNKRYIIGKDGSLNPYSPKDEIQVKQGEAYCYYAYYPFNQDLTPLDWAMFANNRQEVKEWHKANDYMLAQSKNIKGKNVTLTFRHKFSLIELHYAKTSGREISGAEILPIEAHARLNLETGKTVTASGRPPINPIICYKYGENPDYYIFRAYLPPQQIPVSTALMFTSAAGETFNYRPDRECSLKEGEKTIYTIGQRKVTD